MLQCGRQTFTHESHKIIEDPRSWRVGYGFSRRSSPRALISGRRIGEMPDVSCSSTSAALSRKGTGSGDHPTTPPTSTAPASTHPAINSADPPGQQQPQPTRGRSVPTYAGSDIQLDTSQGRSSWRATSKMWKQLSKVTDLRLRSALRQRCSGKSRYVEAVLQASWIRRPADQGTAGRRRPVTRWSRLVRRLRWARLRWAPVGLRAGL